MTGIYQVEFLPVVKVEENIGLYLRQKRKIVEKFFKVRFIEPIQPIIYDFGSIDAEDDTGDVEVEELYMADLELAQYRIVPIDDVSIALKQPLAVTRWATDKATTLLQKPPLSLEILKALQMGEFFIYEDEKAYFLVTNPTKYRQLKNRVMFPGWRYVLEELPAKPAKWTWIPVEGW